MERKVPETAFGEAKVYQVSQRFALLRFKETVEAAALF
jgi:hypothetical protein